MNLFESNIEEERDLGMRCLAEKRSGTEMQVAPTLFGERFDSSLRAAVTNIGPKSVPSHVDQA